MSTFDLNEYVFHYVENGRGDPLVFVHGSGSDYRSWNEQQDRFGNDFNTIAYSRRFHWPNQPISPGEDYSMQQHVEDLHGLLRQVTEQAVHLIGHSYGGFVCLLLAIQHPDLIRSMVLSEPPVITLHVSDPPRPVELLRLLISRPVTAWRIIRFGMQGLEPAKAAIKRGEIDRAREIFGVACLGSEAYHALSDERKNQVRDNIIKAEFLGSGFPPLDKQDLENLHLPVLLLHADNSPRLFQLLTNQLEDLIPGAELNVIPEASHLMHEDNPSAFEYEVRSFLSKHPIE